MASKKNVLLVCRGLTEIDLLPRFQPQPGCRYIVASDDIRIHLEKEKYPWVDTVCYLEQMESLYPVAADVLRLVEPINQWLKSLGGVPGGIPADLLFWIKACEGGKTTQRIQDLLLLIRSYRHLLETQEISSIVILRHPGAEWEDEVLTRVGRRRGIEVHVRGRWRPRVVTAALLAWLKFSAREPYYLACIYKARLWGRRRRDRDHIRANEIVVQLCSAEAKHVGNVLPLMKALKKRGYAPVSLLWRASEAREVMEREGLGVAELETFCPGPELWSAPVRVWRTWRRACRRRQDFLGHAALNYGDLPLGPLLWPSVRAFFGEELAQRYRLQQAARRYFAHHAPEAVRVWGGGILPEGAIVLKAMPPNHPPVHFFWIMNYHDDPYWPKHTPIDLFLAAGDSQKEFLEKMGVPAERIASVGLSRYDHLTEFQQKYGPADSRASLHLPGDYEKYLLFDSNYLLKGYLTIQELSLVTHSLLNFVRGHPAVALIIKPHPAHCPGWLEDLLAYFSLPNVYLIDKNMVPYHALNAADLLITKFSTLALEAMLFKRPVVSVVLDGGERFRIYGDAVERANSLEALRAVLQLMVGDADNLAAWKKNQLKNQAKFLKAYFRGSTTESVHLGAEAVDKFIKMNRVG